ncbi:MAG: hypothetical protein H6718_03160 [Polyangiaceae bacterium]|nr:hypothetical protein [Polyangiaceae bacterium]
MMYLWLALPLAVSIAISLLAQMERKRLHQEPLPDDLGEWKAAPELGPGWERRQLVEPGGIRGDKLIEQTRRREGASVVEVGAERVIRRI